MLQPLNVELASRVGVRTALVAQHLWDMLEDRIPGETDEFDGRRWLRMGQKALTIEMPYLTRHTARYELRKLLQLEIVRSRDLNDNRFDHTNWYCFTEFGTELMLAMKGRGLE